MDNYDDDEEEMKRLEQTQLSQAIPTNTTSVGCLVVGKVSVKTWFYPQLDLDNLFPKLWANESKC